MSTYYQASIGELKKFNLEKWQEESLTVKYDDITTPPDGNPMFPDKNFRSTFLAMTKMAIVTANNAGLGRKMILDANREAGFPGAGFLRGELTVYVVRDDKPTDAGYRYEMRIRDTVNMYESRGLEGTVETFVRDMTTILKKD